jgi:hypothetical protein
MPGPRDSGNDSLARRNSQEDGDPSQAYSKYGKFDQPGIYLFKRLVHGYFSG